MIRFRIRSLSVIGALTLFSIGAELMAQQSVPTRLSRIDGQVISGSISAISKEGEVKLADDVKPHLLEDIRQIVWRPSSVPSVEMGINLRGGGRLQGEVLDLTGETISIRTKMRDAGNQPISVAVRLDDAEAIRFVEKRDPAFEDAVKSPAADFDQLFVVTSDGLSNLKGLIESVGSDKIAISIDSQTKQIARTSAFGVVFAKAAAGPTRRHQVRFVEGSTLPVDSFEMSEQGVILSSGPAKVTVTPTLLSSIDLFTDRLKYLSDLEPIKVDEQPLVLLPRPYQRDRSVRGEPLKLGDQVYSRGIGVQSRSKLVFELPDGAEFFLATIGIDASAKGKGHCEFVILGDGLTLHKETHQGTDPPSMIRVDVAGVRELTLVVNEGEQLDLSDHADWADARLLMKKP